MMSATTTHGIPAFYLCQQLLFRQSSVFTVHFYVTSSKQIEDLNRQASSYIYIGFRHRSSPQIELTMFRNDRSGPAYASNQSSLKCLAKDSIMK